MNCEEKWLVRQAKARDARGLQNCVKAAYKHYIPRMDKPPGPMLADYDEAIAIQQVWVAVASEAETVLGGLVLKAAESYLLLDNIAVHPDHQGRGIGGVLLKLADDEAERQGFDELRLYTHEKMNENIRLYKYLGWAETHRARQDGYNRVFFRKKL